MSSRIATAVGSAIGQSANRLFSRAAPVAGARRRCYGEVLS